MTTLTKNLKIQPNLDDYNEVYRNFSWREFEKENLEKAGNKINASTLSLEPASMEKLATKVALYWEGNGGKKITFTFGEWERYSNKVANFLHKLGVRKGDRVFFFLPRALELYYSFIGALKAGAIPGTLFAAFGQQALIDRLSNSDAKVLFTNKELRQRVEIIKEKLPKLEKVILIEALPNLLKEESEHFEVASLSPDDPAFMLYTSATGNTPVCGIVIPQKAVLQQQLTAQWVLDLKHEDIYWCTADPGWVTGVIYGIIAPWLLRISQVVFEGRFEPAKWYQILQDYKVTVWYTAPTALRMLAKDGKIVKQFDFSALRHICCVGEALTPASISWALEAFNLPIHDTWWQTETGAMMICNFPSLEIEIGAMGKPVPGIEALIVDEIGNALADNETGHLAFKPNWPSIMTDIWKNTPHLQSYLHHGLYFSGDRAKRDENGYFWYVGRADDVIKTSGERVAPFDVEASLMEHPSVLEVGVIGKPDSLRGEIIKAFIVLKPDFQPSEELKNELQLHVKANLAGHAYPREISFVNNLPKNNSGKIVRRVLKAWEIAHLTETPAT